MTRDDLNRAAIALADLATEGTLTADLPVGESMIVLAFQGAGYSWEASRRLTDLMVAMKILHRDDDHGITPGERLPLVQASLAKHRAEAV